MTADPDTLCPGCFATLATAARCPVCGHEPSAPRPPTALAPGSLLNGQFLIGRVLGRPGGFGITYLGFDRRLHARVAIKEYLPRDLAARATDGASILPHGTEDAAVFRFGLGQFEQEAQTLARLDHPNIVRVRQFLEANGSAYLIMDYYQGMTLAEYLERQPGGRLPADTALPLLQPVLDGLRAVHAEGLLHRDIKPANLYLAKTRSGGARPILLDFGAARQAVGERSRSLSVMLTEGYAPFEQYSRKGHQGPWTDVYGAAAVLYRCVTGETPPAANDRMLGDDLKPAGDFGVPAALSAALAAGLALRPEDRPQTVDAFRALLVRPPQSVPPPPVVVGQAPVPPSPPKPAIRPDQRPPRAPTGTAPDLGWLLLALVLLLVIAASAAGYGWWQYAKGQRFVKIADDGRLLPSDAPAWSCVRDDRTGLTWEVKTADGGLRDQNHTYTWYDPDPRTNGGDPGVQGGGTCGGGAGCDTTGYVEAVNHVGLCGARDWRMPGIDELKTLVVKGRSPTIDTDWFPNTPSSWFWSASADASLSAFARGLYFRNGRAVSGLRSFALQVRLVRAGQ